MLQLFRLSFGMRRQDLHLCPGYELRPSRQSLAAQSFRVLLSRISRKPGDRKAYSARYSHVPV